MQGTQSSGPRRFGLVPPPGPSPPSPSFPADLLYGRERHADRQLLLLSRRQGRALRVRLLRWRVDEELDLALWPSAALRRGGHCRRASEDGREDGNGECAGGDDEGIFQHRDLLSEYRPTRGLLHHLRPWENLFTKPWTRLVGVNGS